MSERTIRYAKRNRRLRVPEVHRTAKKAKLQKTSKDASTDHHEAYRKAELKKRVSEAALKAQSQ